MRMKIEFRLQCRVRRDDKTNLFVSSCPSLDLFSQGRTEAEARLAIEDGLSMYLKACWRRGILEEVLRKRGFEQPVVNPPSLPPPDGDDEFVNVSQDKSESIWDVDVPVYLLPSLGGSKGTGKALCPS